MQFFGIQKVSLVDFDTEVACTLFTRGCNFRCPFCHNYELVVYDKDNQEAIPEEEIREYLEKKKGLLTGVVISGGEPTVQPDLEETIRWIKNLGYKVKLDTNGSNPEVMMNLIKEKLIDYVAVDVKNSKEMYPINVGVPSLNLSQVEKTISYLINHDFPYEFRTTIIKEYHTNASIEAMGKWLKGAKIIFLQHFEQSKNVPDKELHAWPKENVLEFQHILEKYIDKVELRGY